jgi:GPI-anchor transamidase subunit GAA1
MSNLLERLHASFFLYIMSTPSSFLKIGSYLPSAVLIAAALMFGGLREWVGAGWVELEDKRPSLEKGKDADLAIASKKKWVPRRRDLLGAFVVTAASHLIGLALFVVISQAWFDIIQLVCSLVLAASCHSLMFMSEFHNRTDVLDSFHARAVEIPFV